MSPLLNELTGARLRCLSFLVTGAIFMETLDGNVIGTALPAMGRSFQVDAVERNVAISAWMAERFGPSPIFTRAIAGFTLSSLACGLVQSLPGFVALRVLQGASGALMVPVGRLLVLRHTPPDRRMAAMSNLVWPALAAPVLGPPLGGVIVSHASWHWIFFLNVPLGLAGLALAWWLIPVQRPATRRSFDWPGFVLSGLGIFALLSALERLAAAVSPVNLGLLAAGGLLLFAALRHFRRARQPMLDLAPLRIPTFRLSVLSRSVSRMAISCLPFLLPVMLQIGFG